MPIPYVFTIYKRRAYIQFLVGLSHSGIVVHNVDIMWSNNNNTYLTDGAIEEWRRMILRARVRPELDKVLWHKEDSIRIAVHVRRGDILPGKRNDLCK